MDVLKTAANYLLGIVSIALIISAISYFQISVSIGLIIVGAIAIVAFLPISVAAFVLIAFLIISIPIVFIGSLFHNTPEEQILKDIEKQKPGYENKVSWSSSKISKTDDRK